jgi:predicted nucleic acid-binding protein
VARYRGDLLAVAELVGELPEIDAVPNEPKDNTVVATAVAGKADYLVTADRAHLLPLGEYRGVRMVSPRAFLALL